MRERAARGEQAGRAWSGALPRPSRSRGPVPAWEPVWSPGIPSVLLARYYLPRGHAVLQGNACQLLREGVEAYPAMLEAIRSAQRSIRLETYMFITDAVGELFGEALAEAAERGVHVRVLYDALGSWTSRGGFFESLRQRGVDIRPFRPLRLGQGLRHLLRRDHRKILVVDGRVAFTGGVNISAHWAPAGQGGNWRDDVLRMEGPAVNELERRFLATWRMAFQDTLRHWIHPRPHREPPPPRGEVALAVLSSRRSIHRAYLHAIQRARRSVLVAAAYFIPDRRMVAVLREAAARGVEVCLLLNARSDHPVLEHATRAFYEKLLPAGIRIFEWQRGVLHAKTAVVDGVWGTLGSFNLERMSLRFNHEVNVVFSDRRLGRALEDSFREDCGSCREVSLVEFRRRPLWQKLLERVLYFFRGIL
ncbi:phospholipase D-like domain-containing protein [Myxococcaceae bacterium GXIMD 01537]